MNLSESETNSKFTKKFLIPFGSVPKAKPELSTSEELFRFVYINLICVVSITLIISFCYLSHVLYVKFWKPLKL